MKELRGLVLSEPFKGKRGVLTVTKWKRTSALFVLLESELTGLEIFRFRATAAETTQIIADVPSVVGVERKEFPGSLWFYGGGKALGFLPDTTAANLKRPNATESTPEGPDGTKVATAKGIPPWAR